MLKRNKKNMNGLERFIDKHFNSLLVFGMIILVIFKGNDINPTVFSALLPIISGAILFYQGKKQSEQKGKDKNKITVSKDTIQIAEDDEVISIDRQNKQD